VLERRHRPLRAAPRPHLVLTRPPGWWTVPAMISFLRRKSTAAVLADAERPGQELRRSLGAFHLTMLGVGAIVGAGIFSSVGEVAAGANGNPGAGPALVVSYILCAIAC